MDADDGDPRQWLGNTPMLNITDDKLRLRVQTVTQFSRSDAERLRSICRYVAAIPFDTPPFASMKITRVTLARRGPVGWYSKAALFQAMLRAAGFPARVRMLRVGPDMYRGLAWSRQVFVLPVVEVWTGGRWVLTDNFVYDPPYLAAAREAVQTRGWPSGFGVYLEGQTDWDGVNDALVMGVRRAGERDPLMGVYDDPQGFGDELRAKSKWRYWLLLAKNRLMTIRIHRAIRRLRNEAGG